MLRFESVSKTYPKEGHPVQALEDVTFEIEAGAFVVVKGPSGCGKSTLLLMAGGMLQPTEGRVFLDGQDLYALSSAQRSRLRAQKIGFVFQQLHLIPYLTIRENIALGLKASSHADGPIGELIEKLGLGHRSNHRPGELSVGEKQRVALARAFAGKPPLILADEPTGNLDPENARRVMEHLHAYNSDGGTVLVVTHGEDAAPFLTQEVRLANGALESSP